MSKIYCLLGKSACGKDSIYRKLKERLPQLASYVMYSTRPMREGEGNGVNYRFVSAEALEQARLSGKLIEKRTYQTVCGLWTYATVDDDQFAGTKGDILMTGTLESYRNLAGYFGQDRVVPLYIEVGDGERLLRSIRREQKEREPKYDEVCRRFLADASDFSEQKLAEAGITERFCNDDLESCTEALSRRILDGDRG